MTSPPLILHISFNQNNGCFSVATTNGFIIYTTDPFTHIFNRDFPNGGIAVAQMLLRTNILALVGGGPSPQFPLNKVMIWDDSQFRSIGELSFRSNVKSVRLRRDCIIVALLQKILVYNFGDLNLLHKIETAENYKGLCEVSQSGEMVLVCMGLRKGEVRVESFSSKRMTRFVTAHDSSVACIALTKDGRLMATASSKGTLVRVFNALEGSLLRELRRGCERAEIYSLCFSLNAPWLAVSSDKGTVHVFSLKDKIDSQSLRINASKHEQNNPNSASTSHLSSFIKGVLPKYFNSEWSVAKFKVQEGLQNTVAFGQQKNTLVIIGIDGSFYRCEFDPVLGGEMTKLEHHNFLR